MQGDVGSMATLEESWGGRKKKGFFLAALRRLLEGDKGPPILTTPPAERVAINVAGSSGNDTHHATCPLIRCSTHTAILCLALNATCTRYINRKGEGRVAPRPPLPKPEHPPAPPASLCLVFWIGGLVPKEGFPLYPPQEPRLTSKSKPPILSTNRLPYWTHGVPTSAPS